jgi:hypothetical protein
MRRMCREAIDLCETELSSDDQISRLASSAAPFAREVELAVEGRDAPWPAVPVGSLRRAIEVVPGDVFGGEFDRRGLRGILYNLRHQSSPPRHGPSKEALNQGTPTHSF